MAVSNEPVEMVTVVFTGGGLGRCSAEDAQQGGYQVLRDTPVDDEPTAKPARKTRAKSTDSD